MIAADHCTRYTGQLDRCVHVGDCSVHEVLYGLAGYLGELLANTTLEDLIEGKVVKKNKKVSWSIFMSHSSLSGDHSEKERAQRP